MTDLQVSAFRPVDAMAEKVVVTASETESAVQRQRKQSVDANPTLPTLSSEIMFNLWCCY